MDSRNRTSSNDPERRLAREQSAPVMSGARLRKTETIPPGFVANASRNWRSRADQSPGEKSGRYSSRISCMAKEPTFIQGLVGSAVPLVVAIAVILLATALYYTFWYGVDWITRYLF